MLYDEPILSYHILSNQLLLLLSMNHIEKPFIIMNGNKYSFNIIHQNKQIHIKDSQYIIFNMYFGRYILYSSPLLISSDLLSSLL